MTYNITLETCYNIPNPELYTVYRNDGYIIKSTYSNSTYTW